MLTTTLPNQIDPNPYQPRLNLDPVALNRLAEDIKEHGLLQPPAARPAGLRYQLIYGHRRLAAWQIAFPDLSITIDVHEMTDQQMFAAAIVENDDREPLNAIERARALQTYISRFKVTQAEAGKLFGLKDQASVSNLLRLLKLPDGVQSHVASGDLPERYARELLAVLPVAGETSLVKLAKKIASAETPGEAAYALEDGLQNILRVAPNLSVYRVKFPGDWVNEFPVDVDGKPHSCACDNCKFVYNRKYDRACLRPACYESKSVQWSARQTRLRAEQTGLASPDDLTNVTPLIGDLHRSPQDQDKAALIQQAIAAKSKSLLLIPAQRDLGNADYWRKKLTGDEAVDIALAPGVTLDQLRTELHLKKKPRKASAASGGKTDYAKRAGHDQKLREQYDELVRNVQTAVKNLIPDFSDDKVLSTNAAMALVVLDDLGENFEWMSDKEELDIQKKIHDKAITASAAIELIIGRALWNVADQKMPSYFLDTARNKPAQREIIRTALADFAKANKVKLHLGWDADLRFPGMTSSAQPKKPTVKTPLSPSGRGPKASRVFRDEGGEGKPKKASKK